LRQGLVEKSSVVVVRLYFPLTGCVGFGRLGSRSLRAHFPRVAEFLENWYDRSAENCPFFINIGAVHEYSVTCTVCRSFENGGCGSTDKVSNVLKLLKNRIQLRCLTLA